MRIAQIAPIIESVPPKKYGGTERVVWNLTEALVKLGHQVTLFASGDSITSARLVSVVSKSIRELNIDDPYGANILNSMHIGLAYSYQNHFDIIHDHQGTMTLPIANIATTPVVSTCHGPFTSEVRQIYETLNKPFIVSISKNQGKPVVSHPHYMGAVYNGINFEGYPFSESNDGYLLFVGRITLEKGVHNAIKVAKLLNLPLIIAAKLETAFKPDVEYFETEIKPHLNDQIKWIGEVEEDERNKLMSKAICLLHPITWPEPFGLTLIEAMACGTPVVAFNLGSIPELIQEGKTGFVVSSVEEMAQAVKKVDMINSSYTRDYARSTFNAERMARGYLRVYEQVLKIAKQPQLFIPDALSPLSVQSSESSSLSYAHDIRQELVLKEKVPTRPKK